MIKHPILALVALSAIVAWPSAHALTVDPFYASDYSAISLGSVPGVPVRYGGLTFLNSNTLLIGGAANGASGNLYSIGVTRGADNHITGFAGTATAFGTIGTFNDGGVVFGPGGVLFTSQWPVNKLGQTKPGSTQEDKVIDLAALGVASSHAALNFVPVGFGGAGHVKLVSWSGGQWYDAQLIPDGSGTYDLSGLAQVTLSDGNNVPGGPEGFVYIKAGNPLFDTDSVMVSEYSAGKVVTFEVDSHGDPLLATARDFLTGLSGAEGAVIDPVTGDFLFSTFGGANQVAEVRGFSVPVPEPTAFALVSLGLATVVVFGSRRRRSRR